MIRAAESLSPPVTHFKIGLELYSAEGPSCVRTLAERGASVFLDLKLHDIPRTVARAVSTLCRPGVALLTVHASGGREMLKAAAQAAAAAGPDAPKLLAVTVLTSLAQPDLADAGVTRPLEEHAVALASIALDAGIHGLVCSPLEVARLRREFGPSPLLVVPGIRPSNADAGDQKRVATPADAARAGASFIVVGRPILEAPDPRCAALGILDELAAAARP
jgi:orotidine-5'-phosphate decarboxylase